MNKIALIHCGFHKTGSTYFQSMLKKNEDKISYYIPKTFRLQFYPINHALLAWKIIDDERSKDYKKNIDDLRKEIKDKKNILLSSEDFSLVLSNPLTKKKFEKIFNDFKIIYLCFFRSDSSRNLSLINEFRYHYVSIKKIKVLKDFINLILKGFTIHSIYKSNEKSYYFTSLKKLVRVFIKNSKGKFFILNYDNNINILKYINKIYIFKNLKYSKQNIYSNKKRKIYNFLKYVIKSKRIFISYKRDLSRIKSLNKIL